MATATSPTRWGIVGAGQISHDFVNSFATQSGKEHWPVAVAARDFTRAQEFAEKHRISTAYGSYAELAADENVEIAYIGVIVPAHYETVKLMLNAGKHVLCEKPLGMCLQQVEEMIDLAKAKGLFFMEGIWSRTFPLYKKLQTILKNGCIGEVKHVITTFGLANRHLPSAKLSKKENGGGTILDFGVYCIQLCLLAFGGQKPDKIVATAAKINENGVDLGVNCILHFPGDGMASFNTDLRVNLPNRAMIAGTKGLITVASPFWCPSTLCLSSNEEDDWCDDFPIPSGAEFPFNFHNTAGLAYEANHVRKCLQLGLTESPLVPHSDSLLIAEIQEEIMRQVGVSYVE